MQIPVHILVTCRNPALFPASELVFDSIRKGFPTAPLIVRGNALDCDQADKIAERVRRLDGVFGNEGTITLHWQWIASLIAHQETSFFICDTDVIFWETMERFTYEGPMSGRLMPPFRCPVTDTDTLPRLHTALLYIEPRLFREFNKEEEELEEINPLLLPLDLVKPVRFAVSSTRVLFNDTLGQAFQLLGGNPFSCDMLDCYDHISCGTYLDLLDAKIPGAMERQMDLIRHPEKARGLWLKQQQYLEAQTI